jgi:FAD/FMN-containing dehydrogenase
MTTTPLLDGLDVLRPGDDRYDPTRAVWNAMVDRKPRLIVRCRDAGEVQAAVRTARELDLEIGVRCGGHSTVGHAVPDDGMMIDLTPMGGARVDPAARKAWVQGGALLGALDRASQQHGLATTAGNVSHTGVGGLTLGGGMGWLARQIGLACDNVTSYQVVTADGELVTATGTEHPELFWGLRGGGGNFGIVTEFEFVLHETGTSALVAEFGFDPADALPVLRGGATWRRTRRGRRRTARRCATGWSRSRSSGSGRRPRATGWCRRCARSAGR